MIAPSYSTLYALLFALSRLGSASPLFERQEGQSIMVPTFDSHEDYIKWRDEELAGEEVSLMLDESTEDNSTSLGPYELQPVPDHGEDSDEEEGSLAAQGFELRRVGDGNPHQDHLHKQLTHTLGCGNGGCSVGQSQTKTFTIGFSAGGTNKGGWIGAGFDVSRSTSTGNSYHCSAVNANVCLWRDFPHTAYTVERVFCGPYNCGRDGAPYVIASPNRNQGSRAFYCVRGNACRSEGSQYWEYNRRRGGP